MASSGTVQNSGSDERKRKRMQSNRESARRSRLRKQKQVDDLAAEAAQLSKDKSQIVAGIEIATRCFVAVEAENQMLRVQMVELNQRLRSLDEIIGFIGAFDPTDCVHSPFNMPYLNMPSGFNMPYLNMPITASADKFQY